MSRRNAFASKRLHFVHYFASFFPADGLGQQLRYYASQAGLLVLVLGIDFVRDLDKNLFDVGTINKVLKPQTRSARVHGWSWRGSAVGDLEPYGLSPADPSREASWRADVVYPKVPQALDRQVKTAISLMMNFIASCELVAPPWWGPLF